MRQAVGKALGVWDALNTALHYVVGLLLALITVVVFIQVMVRLVLTALGVNIAAPWTEELARYLLIWMIFIGAALGCRKMQMIALEFVVSGVPALLGAAVRLVALALCVALFALMLRYGVTFVQIIGRTELSPVMQISKAWVYWAMPFGAALMIGNTLAFLAECWVERRSVLRFGTLGEEV